MEQTRAETPIRADQAALRPRVPTQTRPAARGDDGAARGEHVHSEPAAPPVPVVPPEPAVPGISPVPAPAPAPAGGTGPAAGPKLPRRHSVRGQILAALRDALLSGELAPGEVHSAPALAERFGVSPTPVREAMQQLASEGAVETVPNRGFRVAECGARELAELAEVRALLEVPSVLSAARTAPPESWEALRPLAEETLTAATGGDRAAYAAADRAFHRGVLEVTGNRRLVEIVDDIQCRTQRRPATVPGTRAAAALLGEASEHVALIDALASRDLAAAERLMREHASAV